MSVIYQAHVHDRHITVIELPLGMLMREGRLIERIRAGEFSREFIVEIAESTLPFQNIGNLLQNLMEMTSWTAKNLNLKCVCQMIIKACDGARDLNKVPATSATVLGVVRHHPLPDEDVLIEPIVQMEPEDWDDTGRGVKRYPHTYECILRPEMNDYYKAHRDSEDDTAWRRRVLLDGAARFQERRVESAVRAQEAVL